MDQAVTLSSETPPAGLGRTTSLEHPSPDAAAGFVRSCALDAEARTADYSRRLSERWRHCDELGTIVDQSVDCEDRMRAMYAREPDEWQAPAAEILQGLESVVDATRLADPPEMAGLRGAILLALGRGACLPLVTIAHRQRVTASAVRRAVLRLEHEGLVERERDPDDARVMRVHATAKGAQLAARVRCSRAATLARWLRQSHPDDVVTLIAAAKSAEWLAERVNRRGR